MRSMFTLSPTHGKHDNIGDGQVASSLLTKEKNEIGHNQSTNAQSGMKNIWILHQMDQ